MTQGEALRVDPGPQVIKVRSSMAGRPVTVLDVLAREGEQRRLVTVSIPSLRPRPKEPRPPTPEKPRLSPLFFAASGVSVAALGTFTLFGLRGRSDAGHFRDTCAPRCSDASHDGVARDYLIADVSLAVAVAAAVTAGVLFGLQK